MTKGRESFLDIYQENQDDQNDQNDEPDLSNGIRFKRDADEDDEAFELRTGVESGSKGKPMI